MNRSLQIIPKVQRRKTLSNPKRGRGRPPKLPAMTPQLATYVDPDVREKIFEQTDETTGLFILYIHLQFRVDWNTGYRYCFKDEVCRVCGLNSSDASVKKRLRSLSNLGIYVDFYQEPSGPILIRSIEYEENWGFLESVCSAKLPVDKSIHAFTGKPWSEDEKPPIPEVKMSLLPFTLRLQRILNDPNHVFDPPDGLNDGLKVELHRLVEHEILSRDALWHSMAILRRFESTRIELYSATDKSPRLFPHSISCCPRDLRKWFQREMGFTTYDLVACQLHVVMSLWAVKSLEHLLEEGRFWFRLAEMVDVDPATSKDVLKKAVYSIVFGCNESTSFETVTRGLGLRAAYRFHNTELIQELFVKRDAELEQIKIDGYVIDAFGNTLTAEGRDHKSLCAHKVQSYEHFIAGTLALAVHDSGLASLEMFLHDGFSVKVDAGNEDDLDGLIEAKVNELNDQTGMLIDIEKEQ